METKPKIKKAIPKPTNFGKNLKFLRRLAMLSQQNLAKDLGVNRNNIASYESGLVEPSATLFIKTCEYFNKSPRLMMDSLMVEETLETSPIPNILEEETDAVQELFKEQLEQFVYHTNEMTKMYEGYSTMIEMKIMKEKDDESIKLYSTFTDLLDLMKTLITLNWEMMHSIVPTEITMQNIKK